MAEAGIVSGYRCQKYFVHRCTKGHTRIGQPYLVRLASNRWIVRYNCVVPPTGCASQAQVGFP
jgi:hypothetical protein